MAGRSRADDQDRGVQAVSERSLLAGDETGLPSALERTHEAEQRQARPEADHAVLPRSPPRLRLGTLAGAGVARFRPAVSLGKIAADATRAAGIEFDRGLAFLLVPVFLAAGAIFYFSLPTEPGWTQPAATALALAAIVFAARDRPIVHPACAAALLVALGVLAAKVETWRAGGQTLGAAISTRVTGRVVSIDDMASGRVRLTVDVVSTARPKLRYQPQRVRLSARAIAPNVKAGSTVRGYARLLPPTGPVRPDSYDFSFDSYFAGIGASGFFLTNPKLVAGEPAPLSVRFWTAVEDARNAIADHVRKSIGGPEGEIAAALIVGVRAGIPETVNEAMRKTGIYHIISISGLHMN